LPRRQDFENRPAACCFQKNAQVAEFGPLTGEKQAAWIEAEFAAIGCKIDRGAATLLAQRAGGDLWNLANEIQKIGHFLGPKIITAADIENNAVATSELNIFATIDAVAQRDKKRALGLIKEHIAKGDHPLYLLAMMASQFKNLFLVKICAEEGGSAARLGIHPYVLSKTTGQARQFTIEELKKIYRLICRTDLDIKTGKIDPEAGLDLLVSQI